MQLFSHGKLIEQLVTKVDGLGLSVQGMQTTMGHLVTKASCAEGRKALSDDLKARMDGDREITGMNITLPALLSKYSRTEKPSPAPLPRTPVGSTRPSGHPREPKTVLYYVKAASAIISLTFAIFTMTFFAFKMIARLDEQQQVMRSIQQDLEEMDTARAREQHTPSTFSIPIRPQD
jgi:hypothetical protein